MGVAINQLNLSARPIADLAGGEEIQSIHLADALQYKPKLVMVQVEETLNSKLAGFF